ncbi:hypothetical protein OIU76_005004 [Salix suchowensis]|nr:hypothetical protein OIU76_005004 [Salix suchowensis]
METIIIFLTSYKTQLEGGQNPISILPTAVAETEITTISDPYVGILGKFEDQVLNILMIGFPQTSGKKNKKRRQKQILEAARGASGLHYNSPSVQVGKDSLSPMERAAGNERMVLDIKVKLQVPFRILMSYLALRVPWFLGLSGVRYSDGNNNNLLDKLQDTIGRGQNPISILPPAVAETEITTISDPYVGILGKFEVRRKEEKRKKILAVARGASGYIKHAPRYLFFCLVYGYFTSLYSKVKLQGLWLRFRKLGDTTDLLSSFEYGTILVILLQGTD